MRVTDKTLLRFCFEIKCWSNNAPALEHQGKLMPCRKKGRGEPVNKERYGLKSSRVGEDGSRQKTGEIGSTSYPS